MSLRTRLTAAAVGFLRRAVASDYGPFAPEVNGMWSIVRGQDPTPFVRTGQTVRETGVEGSAVVHACVRAIAQQVASVGLEAYRMTNTGDVDPLPTSPLQLLLDRPAPQLSTYRLLAKVTTHLVTYGNAFVVLERNPRGAVVRVRVVNPERLSHILVENTSDMVAAYVWTDSNGTRHTTPYTDMVHVADLDTDADGWFGFPRLAAALADMVADGDATKYVRQVLVNAGVPSMVMMAEPGSSVAELKAAEDAWQERMAARGGRGKVRFVGGIKDVKVIGHTLAELEFPSLRQISREDICAAAGVDPRLVGIGSATKDGGLSGAQYAEARRRLEQQTCAPLRRLICDALDHVLAPEFTDGFVRFAPDELARLLETPAEVAQRVAVLMSANVLTLEESRRMVGVADDMDPTHHTLAASIRTVEQAMAAALMPPPAPPLLAAPADAEPNDDTADTEDDAPAALDTAADDAEDAAEDDAETRAAPLPSRRNGPKLTKAQRQALAAAFDARATAEEKAYQDKAQAVFQLEAQDVADILAAGQRNAHAPHVRASFFDRVDAAIADYYAKDGKAWAQWLRAFTPEITLTVTRAAAELAAELGAAFDVSNPRVLDAVAGRVNKLTGNVSDTTLQQLRVLIAAGRQAGQGPEEISRVIMQAVFDPAITEQRALLIARTETVGALNEGEWLAAQEAGMRAKAWLDVQDSKVRETHTTNANRGWIAMDALFPDGLRYPHDPNGSAADVIQCRCSLLFSDLAPADANAEQPMGDA